MEDLVQLHKRKSLQVVEFVNGKFAILTDDDKYLDLKNYTHAWAKTSEYFTADCTTSIKKTMKAIVLEIINYFKEYETYDIKKTYSLEEFLNS